MSISIQQLEKRREALVLSLEAAEATLEDLKDRTKNIKKEIANAKGAILELDRLIEE